MLYPVDVVYIYIYIYIRSRSIFHTRIIKINFEVLLILHSLYINMQLIYSIYMNYIKQ